jgi:hypothetical protein
MWQQMYCTEKNATAFAVNCSVMYTLQTLLKAAEPTVKNEKDFQ